MVEATVKNSAQKGDVSAIALLLQDWLQSYNLTATVKAKEDILQISLIASTPPKANIYIPLLKNKFHELNPQGYKLVKVCGKDQEDDFSNWYEEFSLEKPSSQLPDGFQSIECVMEKLSETAGSVWGSTNEAGRIAMEVGSVVTNVANKAGKAVTKTTIDFSDNVGKVALGANKTFSSTFGWIEENPLARQVTKRLPFNWLFVVDRVDVNKAAKEVEKLQRENPQEDASEIAHRLITQKAVLAAGSGLVTSLIPGFAIPLFAVDLAATASLQAELVYQIAHAYEFDIHDEARKGEALVVLGLALGGGQAIKVGGAFATRAGIIGILRNIPMAGAAIGLSTNAAITYSLGYAACRFYEAKKMPLSSEEALSVSQVATEEYLETALAQEVVMDQVLIHVLLAAHPHKSSSQLLEELNSLISPTSREEITTMINNPPPLKDLLRQLNRDYALPLLVKCYSVAQLDGEIKPEVAQVIDEITQWFAIDIDSLAEMSSEAMYAQG